MWPPGGQGDPPETRVGAEELAHHRANHSEGGAFTLNPANRAGSALGNSTLTKRWTVERPIERAITSVSGSTLKSPAAVLTVIGKNAIRNAISTFGSSPKPNQTVNSGASASFGLAGWLAINAG